MRKPSPQIEAVEVTTGIIFVIRARRGGYNSDPDGESSTCFLVERLEIRTSVTGRDRDET